MTQPNPQTKGAVVSHAFGYDVLVWLLALGRTNRIRQRFIQLARIDNGESVLDVGCGTGSLAIAVKRHVGSTGAVEGLDASTAMIERARLKAKKAHEDVTFTIDVVEKMPYPPNKFDVVLSTLMLHHLRRDIRRQSAIEMRRVLKPGGRILAVDFGPSPTGKRGLIGHFHQHAGVKLENMIGLFQETGCEITESGEVGISGLNYVLARRTA